MTNVHKFIKIGPWSTLILKLLWMTMFPTGKNNTVKNRSKIISSFLLSPPPPPPSPLALHHCSLAATCLCPLCPSERRPGDNRTVSLTERRMALCGTQPSGLTERDTGLFHWGWQAPMGSYPGAGERSEWKVCAQNMALQGWGKRFKPFS